MGAVEMERSEQITGISDETGWSGKEQEKNPR